MATIDVINQAGAVVGSIELNDAVFGIEPHQQAMYGSLVMQGKPVVKELLTLRVVAKFLVVDASLTVKKVRDVLVKVLSVLLNLEVVELYSELLHVTMHTALTKKFAV